MAQHAAQNGKITPIHRGVMSRGKNMIYYTVPEHADTLLIPIKSKTDNDKARNKAVDEILRRMNDEDDDSLDPDSFSDGLDSSRLVVVEPPEALAAPEADKESGPDSIEVAAADLARFSLVRVNFQQHQEEAQTYLPLIEALFSDEPLTEEQIKDAKNKNFPKSIAKLAKAKVEFDDFRSRAVSAWDMLKPLIMGQNKNAKFDG